MHGTLGPLARTVTDLAVVVPAGFTRDKLPVGITFLGRPYSDADMLRLAYAYEQATRHRQVPMTTP
jgi:Asp-tRNA(Asn)/Glu-tRNA(Gln) amidotransferase A subunit family amidase